MAELLLDCCVSDPVLAKRMRLVLSAKDGDEKLDKAIARRISSVARSRALVDWQRCKTYIRELDDLRKIIHMNLGKSNPQEAINQLWNFMDLSSNIMDRLEDEHWRAETLFVEALENIGELYLKISNLDKIALSERLFQIFKSRENEVTFTIVKAMSEALGAEGRAYLRELLYTLTTDERKDWIIVSALCDLADADHDVDAYIKAANDRSKQNYKNAQEIAKRLLDHERAEEALGWLEQSNQLSWDHNHAAINLKIEALEQLGRKSEAQNERLSWFQKTLSIDHLREYLKQLPDFEDFEAEEEAITYALSFHDVLKALTFLSQWPNLETAAKLVCDRERRL